MSDVVILYWIFARPLALLVLLVAVALLAYCVWDGWGRYKAMLREAERAKREKP